MYKQKKLSEDFIQKIIDKTAGRIPSGVTDNFLKTVDSEIALHYFTTSSESNLLRIIQNQYDITFFISECLKYQHYLEILIAIATNSNYLSDILVRNPEYFYWITTPSVLEYKIDENYFKKILNNLTSSYKSFESKLNTIKNFKRKEILRIGLKDIYLKEELDNITRYLSSLAIVITTELFVLCFNEILRKHNITKTTNKYVIISLGKLGGNELNYSSDIDLIAFYDKNTFINKKIFFQQILTETILLFIETASKSTAKGFLYRIDFRLRPDGRNAPMCGSFAEYIRYYEMRGEDWERQMLIKANFLCGSKTLYNNFSNYLSTFVYPSTFSVSPFEQIRKLKASIEKRIKSDENIKLAPGGIRNIEFSIQALQLLNGGKDSSIRSGNTLESVEKLKHKNILTADEYNIFTESYIFYRKVEHYLQLMNDRQTHDIPAEGVFAEKIADFFGQKDLKSFSLKLTGYKKSVQKVYNSIVGDAIISNTVNDFEKIFFSDKKRAVKNLEFLRTGKSLFDKKQFDARATASFEKIENKLILFLTNSVDTDGVLENFARFIKTANFPQIWYDEFLNDKFFALLLNICELSQKAVELFGEDKLVRDEFLSRQSLIPLNLNNTTELNIKSFTFRSAIQLISGLMLSKDFSRLYANFLNHKFVHLSNNFVSDKKWRDNFFIAAMGSYGAEELTFASDCDLIFVTSRIQNYSDIQKDFQKLLKIFRESLPGIEIDCRLRPEGKNSLLVWDIMDYKKYFQSRARIWELQAFTKCRFVYGNNNLFNEFSGHYINTVKQKDSRLIKSEIVEMRKKLLPISDDTFNIKKSKGGLLDIDFINSFLLLCNPELINKREGCGVLDSFAVLKNNSLKEIIFETLESNFLFLKQIELVNQNVFNTKISKIPTEDKKLTMLSKALGFENCKTFLNKLDVSVKQVKSDFQKIFS